MTAEETALAKRAKLQTKYEAAKERIAMFKHRPEAVNETRLIALVLEKAIASLDEVIRAIRAERAETERRLEALGNLAIMRAASVNASGIVSGGSNFHGRADYDPDAGKTGKRISLDVCHAAGLPAGACCGCATHLEDA